MRRDRLPVPVLLLSVALGVQTQAAAAGEDAALMLHGSVSTDLKHLATVEYATTVNAPDCKFEDNITGMWIALRESHSFEPEIRNGRYRLRVPFTRPGGAGACGWTALTVYLCVDAASAKEPPDHCATLYIVRNDGASPHPEATFTCSSKNWNCVMLPASNEPLRQIPIANHDVRLNLEVTAAELPSP